MPQKNTNGLTKTQQKKMEQVAPRPPPPKPVIPDGIDIPSDEEENWLDLWDLVDEELERRLIRAKRRAARARKELRIKQKSGKAERRAARDEKRRVYREIKQGWKIIREEERRRRKFLLSMEDSERKKLATEVTTKNRREAMECCEALGFTLQNVEGVKEIQPRALGMKGMEVDFGKLEFVGDNASGLRIAGKEPKEQKRKSNRVDLGAIADESSARSVYGPYNTSGDPSNLDQNYVEFGDGVEPDYQPLNYNHKVRRKLRRAMDSAQIKKELLVREAAIKNCEENNIPVPPILRTPAKPENIKGQRTMPDGTLETAKQERVRARVELIEFNKMAKILRKQGIRIYLELMERIPKREGLDEEMAARAAAKMSPEGQLPERDGAWMGESIAKLLEDWPMPEDVHAPTDEGVVNGLSNGNEPYEEESSEDSAARQLQAEMAVSQINGITPENEEMSGSSEGEYQSEDEDDSDVDMGEAS